MEVLLDSFPLSVRFPVERVEGHAPLEAFSFSFLCPKTGVGGQIENKLTIFSITASVTFLK